MMKFCLTFVLCFCVSSAAMAQSRAEAMRFLMVNAMLQYGQKLYDRGDFDEAGAVFNHILVYDSRQPQALQYLKKMGKPAVLPADAHTPVSVDVMDADSLRQAIAQQKQVIAHLRSDIKQMRENLASRAQEE